MNFKNIQKEIQLFSDSKTVTSEDLNEIRSEIFDSYDNVEITDSQKLDLLRSLYSSASKKRLFYLPITERNTSHLPKDSYEEEEDFDSYEESYEESYDEDDYDDEDDEEEEESKS